MNLLRNFSKLFIVAGLVIAALAIVKLKKTGVKKTGYTVGILQFVSHPALDNARSGFVNRIKELAGDKINIVMQNAEGSMIMAQSIAERFHADSSLDAIFAIATPAAQAVHAVEQYKPVAIAAVTDPVAAGLVTPGGNVCGSCDMIDAQALVDLLISVVPTAKRVGILFSPSEINSVTLANQMRNALRAHGRETLDVGLAEGADIALAVGIACSKVDALIAPTDNAVASSIQVIASTARSNNIPLFVSDNLLVAQGPLAAQGVDYSKSGAQAAQCLHDVLLCGKKPSDLAIKKPEGLEIVVNKTILDELGLVLPQSLHERVRLVKE